MKKILAVLTIATLIGFASFAQTTSTTYMKTSLTSAVDSVRAGSTTTTYLYAAPILSYKTAAIQTRARRTTAAQGGTIFLQGSNDNVTWFTFSNAAGDTVTIADAATSTGKIIVPASVGIPWKYLRTAITNASTDTSYVKALINLR